MKRFTPGAIAFGIGAAVCVAFWLTALPFTAMPWGVAALAAAAAILSIFHYNNCGGTKEEIALASVATVLICGVALNLKLFCVDNGASFAAPILHNDDSSRLFNCALQLFNGEEVTVHMAYKGLPAAIAAIWHITGVNMAVPLLLNTILTLATIALVPAITRRILSSEALSPDAVNKIAGNALICTALCCYFVGEGTLFLKEPPLYLGIALILYSLAGLRRQNRWADWLIFTTGAIITASLRDGYILYFLISTPLFARKGNTLRIAAAIGIMAIIFGLGRYFSSHSAFYYTETITQNMGISESYLTDPAHTSYNILFKDYYLMPLWKQIALLPVTAGIQFLIPFPFDFTKYWQFGYTQSLCQFAFPWYIMGGVLLFFLFRFATRLYLWRWSAIAIVSFAAPAIMFAGSVSRYWLPFMPLYAVLIAYAWHLLKENKAVRRQFKIFYGVYTLILILSLATAALIV